VAKARELAELEASTGGKQLFSDFTSSIDTKGTVSIRLASGGAIRDTGKRITYSAHDEVAREAALLFAQAKWGKTLRTKGNILSPLGRSANEKGLISESRGK